MTTWARTTDSIPDGARPKRRPTDTDPVEKIDSSTQKNGHEAPFFSTLLTGKTVELMVGPGRFELPTS